MAMNQVKRADAAALVATLAGWTFMLLGERVLVSSEGLAKACTWLGVIGLVGALAERVWAVQNSSVDRRLAARVFLGLSLANLAALVLYGLSTTRGRAFVNVPKASADAVDNFGSAVTIGFVALLLSSLLPSIFGEVARWSMNRAETLESRRILAAVAAGLSLGAAATYGSLFTYAADKADKSIDFSYYRVSRPSESTKRMIESLPEPLDVLVFVPPTTEVRSEVLKYLDDLKAGRADKINISMHDFLGEPELAKEHKLTKDGVLVLARGKASQKLEVGVDEEKARRTLKKLDGEFQKVLIKAMRDKRTAYLTVGHGELNEDTDKRNSRTAEGVRQLLESQNYQVRTLGLADGLASEIPKDASAVLVLGPTARFSDAEVETLRKYADGGGRLLLALDPDSKAEHGPLASLVGVEWRAKLAVNEVPQARMQGTSADKKILVATTFSSHASVSTLGKAGQSAPVLFVGAAPLGKSKDADKGLLVDFNVKSAPSAFLDEDDDLELDTGTEKKAVQNLAAAVTRRLGEGKDALEMRAFILGDADVFSDFWFVQDRNNQLLFVEAVRWLGGDESFSGEIQSEEDVAIVHTKAEDQAYFYGTIVGAPSLVLGLGLFVTLRRRRDGKAEPSKNAEKARPSGDKTRPREPRSAPERGESNQAPAKAASKKISDDESDEEGEA
ncbi:MAG: Gldg family protein [Deltaproteobacteria bacterium]|nr:Gldg family protein [Deltaproteobacteria bacterium]